MKTFYRKSQYQDIPLLAPKLRKTDLDELEASTGQSPVEALEYGLDVSDLAWTLFSRGEPVCIGGVAPYPEGGRIGIAWFLATDGLARSATALQRWLPDVIGEMHMLYPSLANFIDARNEVSHRWLEHLGFHRVGTCEEYGVGRMPFHWYVKTKDSKGLSRKERKLLRCVPQQCP